ncbi:hypothetical protein L226DRAFT_464445 [Lentinus tigrinus ALCF2SS1-7]|uniref:Uncharacterized protein n=1 Tax=Lentinus tigrinus ALCF2SS1-6 TaxID=1328759 RepID=A0A5C2RNX9_9APHY|nr:hypothetical protein L227DRAFT_515168 [Lentinus tigrinus ALCF2SS1-6]RPD73922.1 hypothetical protein L226DRAFT_464445 [Lentinus tigrinus ALCF2SS1-7]
MLEVALEYCEAIDKITGRGNKKYDLRELELTDDEWEMAEQLRKVLKLFSDATLFFSCARTSNLINVIPAMDHLDNKLAKIALDPAFSQPVHTAASLSWKTCNRYYGQTDDSFVYHFAMGKHLISIIHEHF